MPLPKVMVVVGPTASGKTEIGLGLAKEFRGEIVSADSRTIYTGLDIGTAKPTGERQLGGSLIDMTAAKPLLVDGIPHWGMDIVEPDQIFTVAEYQSYADQIIDGILERGRVPIVVGGTGLYVRALVDRPTFTEVPPTESLRARLAKLSDQQMMAEIADRDPDTASIIDPHNRRRLERALEILLATGKPLAETQAFSQPRYEVLQLGLDVDRDEVYRRIDDRVDYMISAGLVDEVRGLRSKYGDQAPAMTGIGYRQICEFLGGQATLKQAIENIKRDTRHYAKRQETWFKRDSRIVWIKNFNQARAVAKEFLLK